MIPKLTNIKKHEEDLDNTMATIRHEGRLEHQGKAYSDVLVASIGLVKQGLNPYNDQLIEEGLKLTRSTVALFNQGIDNTIIIDGEMGRVERVAGEARAEIKAKF